MLKKMKIMSQEPFFLLFTQVELHLEESVARSDKDHSLMELETLRIWVAFGLLTGAGLNLSGRLAVCLQTHQTLDNKCALWRVASRNSAAGPLLFQTWTAGQFASTEVRSSQVA